MSQDIARSTGDEQENVTKALSAYVKTGKGATKLAKAYKLNADLLGNGATESERLAEVWKAFSQSSHMGASTEYLKTFDGQLSAVKGRLDDMKEPVGELINTLLGGNSEGLSGSTGAMASLGEAIKNATADIQSMTDKSKELGGGIIGVGLACAEAHPLATSFVLAIAGGETLSMFANLITSIATIKGAIVGLGGAISVATGLAMGLVSALALLVAGAMNWMSLSPEVQESLNATQREANGVQQFNNSIYGGIDPSTYDMSNSKYGKKNATGTNYFEGGWTHVNENGGEIMNLPNGTQIIPHDVSTKMGGGYTINAPVTIQGNVIGNSEFIDEIGNALSNRISLAIANM